ncbi:hypothetical protein [Scytonema sp. PCC 10023]|uniref:hypothetical protein n=1 Tax=Scytonema sp. PCC 10023 TaxID=1680591 RepID=UPI0039C677E1
MAASSFIKSHISVVSHRFFCFFNDLCKSYGKGISAKSPGFVQSELIRKAEKAGGSVHKFSTQKTALSQTHLDGSRIKKSLSERVHRDATGIKMHRDLFSAYLSRYVNQDDTLSVQDARTGYCGAEPKKVGGV